MKKIKELIFPITIRILPTKLHLHIFYRYFTKKKLNLKKPQTLNEKLQWKKIYDKGKIYETCADKYAVRKYVKNQVGEDYLIPLLAHSDKIEKIDFKKIPLPFVIKTNNGSGQNLIIKNKEEFNQADVIKKFKKWIKYNHYWFGREPQYKRIKPLIIVEKLLIEKDGKIPNDYKFHCFDGKVEFISVNSNRFENHKETFFYKNWKPCPFTWCPKSKGKPRYKQDKEIPKPNNLKEMIKVAEKLSKNFDYIRVDLYISKGKIYFGELTFHHGAGFSCFFPEKYDLVYGGKLKLKKCIKPSSICKKLSRKSQNTLKKESKKH